VTASPPNSALDFDAIIIGAGLSGMYQLHRLRELGLRTRVFEAGTDVGGTWYWNRYPGARFDSESYSYGFSFSKELLAEWDWSEHFAGQPETLRYCNFVADKLDLRRDIQFKSRVTSAVYN
jgi:cation diffusion facilitator CzcD-associated flavoprotein CzcO